MTAKVYILAVIFSNLLTTLRSRGLLNKEIESCMYQGELDRFIRWCDTNHLISDVTKTQEMVLDPRLVMEHEPEVIKHQKNHSVLI